MGLLGASLSTLGLRHFAKRHGLLRPDVDHDEVVNRWQALGASTVILCPIPIAWVNPIAGIATWALIIPVPRLLQAVMERRRPFTN